MLRPCLPGESWISLIIAVMVMTVDAMIVVMAAAVVIVMVAVVIISMAPINSAVVTIVGLRLVHGQ